MKNKITITFIVIGVLLFGILGYLIYSDYNKITTKDKEKIDSIGLYGYTLSESDTEIYKNNYEELRSILNAEEINYEEYAKSISKLFIIDLFTINNKKGSTDIGGIEFIHNDLVSSFKEYIGSSLYKDVKVNLDGKRSQSLPEVMSINANGIEQITYNYNEVDYDGYKVSLSWEYKEDLGYQNSISLYLIKDENILYIVKGE